jgi:hypothetical protein
MKRKSRIRRWVALGLAVGALAVATSAQARPLSEQELAGLGPSPTPVSVVSPVDRPVLRANDGTAQSLPPEYATVDSTKFDWDAFGIGLGAALGVMLVALGVAWFARHRRRLATLH